MDFLIWMGVLAAPVVAAIAFALIRPEPNYLRNPWLIAAEVFLGLFILALVAKTNFTILEVNVGCILLAYLAYCFLVLSVLKIKRRLFRIPLLGIGVLPIILGYLLSTIGFLALLVIAADYTQPALSTELVAPGLTCTKTGWGMVTSEGHTFHLYRTWPGLAVVHTEIKQVVVDYSDPEDGQPDTSCAELGKARR
jgi:hypothetical protein